jgi:protoporphyrinogen oxidase
VLGRRASRAAGSAVRASRRGHPWDRVISQTDTELLALIGELGLAGELRWSRTHTGVLIDGRLHGLDGPLDLLRFKALSRPDRLRAGVAALYAAGRRHGGDLDLVRAVDWLPRLFGARVFGRRGALLRARFGDR